MRNVLEGDDDNEAPGVMGPLLEMADLIQSDPFWDSQIVQVYVNGKGEYELIPRVGSHIILLGTGEQIETKFFKLRTLYEEGFSRQGWNQYEIINLKYDKQVICTKR
jgi:cell division protein FtsQ